MMAEITRPERALYFLLPGRLVCGEIDDSIFIYLDANHYWILDCFYKQLSILHMWSTHAYIFIFTRLVFISMSVCFLIGHRSTFLILFIHSTLDNAG